jgi:hypothetical protein
MLPHTVDKRFGLPSKDRAALSPISPLSLHHTSTRWRGGVRRTVRREGTGEETVNNNKLQGRRSIYLYYLYDN